MMNNEAIEILRAMSEELKPCPFCGGKAVLQWISEDSFYALRPEISYWVECNGCEVRTKKYREIKEAVEAWNRRASDEYPT